MSNRERWIVYPLLFFSIALSWKSVVRTHGNVEFRTIRCQKIDVRSSDSRPAVRIVGSEDSGSITLFGQDGIPLAMLTASRNGTSGSLELANPPKLSKVSINAADEGGRIQLGSTPTKPEIIVGFDAADVSPGLFAVDAKNVRCQTEYQPDGLEFFTVADIQRQETSSTSNHE
jgi:hypothetical protein